MHYFNTNVLDLFKFNFLKNEIPRENFILTFYFVDKIFIYALDYSSYSTSKNQPNPTYSFCSFFLVNLFLHIKSSPFFLTYTSYSEW